MANRGEGEHVGTVVATLAAGAVAVLLGSAMVGLLVGLPAWQVLVLALGAPLSLSSLSGVALAGFLLVARPGRAALAGGPCPPDASPERLAAEAAVADHEHRLLRAVELAAGEAELMRHALALHSARLQLANVMLAEDGDLPQTLKDELLVAHRGTADWLRAGRLS